MLVKKPFFENKNLFVQILVLLFLVLAGFCIVGTLGVFIAKLIYGNDISALTATAQASYHRLVQAFSTIGAFAVPALLFAYCQTGDFVSYNKLNKIPHYLSMDVVLVLSVFILPVTAGLAYWNEQMQLPETLSGMEQWMRQTEDAAADLLQLLTQDPRVGILLVNVLVFAVLPAISEELLFRGTVQPLLNKWTKNPHLAIWITAFIFSAIHLQFYGFIPRFLLGAYLGYLLYWSGSIWLPILAHFLHNSLSIIIDFIMFRRGVDVENVEITDFQNFIPLLIVASCICIIGVVMLKKMKKLTANS